MTITICCAQISGNEQDPKETLERAGRLVKEAAAAGAALVAFPEQFATGWDPHSVRHLQDESGEIVCGLRSLARDHAIAIVGSYRESGMPKPRNTAIAIGPDGKILAKYSKIHLFIPEGEDKAFSPGDRIATFPLEGITFGLAICYDLRFPDLFVAYARAGTDCMIVPSAWPCERIGHFRLFVNARALENQFFVAGVNTPGTLHTPRYCGQSLVADPAGRVIACGSEVEECVTACIDTDIIEEERSRMPIHSHRRDDLYIELNRDSTGR